MTMVEAHVSAHELVAGRYRLLEVFSRETNRVWWYAEDVPAGRPRLVARTGLPAAADPETLHHATVRIVRTAETMCLLRPGRVAPVVDAFVEAGSLWTATDWIGGTPLGELLDREGPFSPERAARIGLDVLGVLDAAHDEGITHGELSPGQILVRDSGPAVVTGFGLAGTTLAPRLTAPSYASPEQARDERVGPAADLWALGAILYTMVEGRPPFRDRGRPEATLRAVERLPVRTPLRAGPLTQAVRGLLRKNPRERLTRPVAFESLTRALEEGAAQDAGPAPASGRPGAWPSGRSGIRATRRRVLVAAAVLAVTAAGTAVAVSRSGTGTTAAESPSRRTVTAAPPAGPAETAATQTSGATSGTGGSPGTGTASALPAGYRVHSAPEGFSVALPQGWRRLSTERAADHAYRVTFGQGDGPPTLAVTYSERVGADPVAVWRNDVEPGLRQLSGYQRVGAVRATTYQGRAAADLEWLSGTGDARAHTFGRGFVLGGGRGFSLRFTTRAADWDDAAARLALGTFLSTFRAPRG
ncbi:serine/threonine protein kinase [Streptomyces sp. NPDC090108]|uniref:serine/threonine protein kinase n=1 Tax=Streptomyces sp. NPDC090108 TaxID=3365947 RepID=UPI0038052920